MYKWFSWQLDVHTICLVKAPTKSVNCVCTKISNRNMKCSSLFRIRSKKRLELAPSAVSVNQSSKKKAKCNGERAKLATLVIHMKWCWVRVAGDKLQTSLLLSCFQLRSCVCGQRFECVSALAHIWLAGNFTTTDRMLQHRAIAICHPQFHSYFGTVLSSFLSNLFSLFEQPVSMRLRFTMDFRRVY